MRQSGFVAVAAFALAGADGSAAAAIWQSSGELTPGGVYTLIPALLPGTYVFRWNSTAALPQIPYSSTFEDDYYYTYNLYFEDGTNYGGDDDLGDEYFDLAPSATQDPYNFSRTFTIVPLPKDYVIKYPDGAIKEAGFYYFIGADISLYPAQDFGSYSTSISAIPEPSTWTMTLVGFAGLGLAGRRALAARRASQAD